MDIVGPLPKSHSGKRFVLVVCDYATRYPEAVALRSIDAEHIAEALVQIFSRVGVPEEILTDQGTHFMSQLLAEVYKLLRMKSIRTSPYHPQTDGLVERFNKTLKAMLRKTAISEGKDWDKLIPYVLFAYREVPHASTALRVTLRTRAVGSDQRDLGGFNSNYRECIVVRVSNEREADPDDRARPRKFIEGTSCAEDVVRQDSSGTEFRTRRQGPSATTDVD